MALVHSSTHPISKGIAEYLVSTYEEIGELELSDIKSIDAKGITARYNQQTLVGGNLALMQEKNIRTEFQSDKTLFIFAIDGQVMAEFELEDKIKDDAVKSIQKIKKQGIRVVMLTGDHDKSAQSIAKAVGITKVYSALLPIDKAELIDKFHDDGHIVVMAGDGINDAIALAKSDIACAIGSGADIAIEVSDVVLLDDRLESLAVAFEISKRTFAAVKQNLGFSIMYNIFAVPLAVMGFVTPLIAAISMSLSSLVVVVNSSRIKTKEDG